MIAEACVAPDSVPGAAHRLHVTSPGDCLPCTVSGTACLSSAGSEGAPAPPLPSQPGSQVPHRAQLQAAGQSRRGVTSYRSGALPLGREE